MAAVVALQTAYWARVQSQKPQQRSAAACGPRYVPLRARKQLQWHALTQKVAAAAAAGGGSSSGGSSGGSSSGGSSSDSSLPSSTAGVAGWAASAFREAAKSNLTKACLLLALEEEAASQAAYAEAELMGDDGVLRGTVGSAGTWSLQRIASLADEATLAFYQALGQLGVADAVTSAAQTVSDSTLLTLHMDLVRSYPTQLITAINHVLFERHGYRRQRKFGNPLDSRLSNVLEDGNGSSGSLAVLYLEICARLSLPLHPVALEGGRYFVLIPADDSVSLAAAGERFCIDPYSEGMLLSESEVCELFEVEGGALQPCSNEAVLAGILRVLLDSHWCAAVGCPPEPVFMVPVSLELALGKYRDVEVQASSGEDDEGEYFRVSFTEQDEGQMQGFGGQQWWPQQGYHLQRALAAAQKRSWLLPGDLHALLELALLLYFNQRYEDAWQELGCVLQAARGQPQEQQAFSEEQVQEMEVLWEKVRLQLAFAGS